MERQLRTKREREIIIFYATLLESTKYFCKKVSKAVKKSKKNPKNTPFLTFLMENDKKNRVYMKALFFLKGPAGAFPRKRTEGQKC